MCEDALRMASYRNFRRPATLRALGAYRLRWFMEMGSSAGMSGNVTLAIPQAAKTPEFKEGGDCFSVQRYLRGGA